MGLGRNPYRASAPLPFGMLPPQLYRWAKLMTRWFAGFTESTWASTSSTTIGVASSYTLTPRISVNTSVGASAKFNVRILTPDGFTLNRRAWFRSWFASSKSSPPINAGVSLLFSTGSLLHTAVRPRMYYVYTGTGHSAQFRVNGLPVSAYMAVQVADTPPVWSIKISGTSTVDLRWYPYASVYAESGNSRKIYIEARKSADGSRFQADLLVHFRFDQTQAGTVNPSLASVNWSGSALNIQTATANRVYMVRLGSSGQNWLRISKAAAGPVCCRLHKPDAGVSYVLFSTSFA